MYRISTITILLILMLPAVGVWAAATLTMTTPMGRNAFYRYETPKVTVQLSNDGSAPIGLGEVVLDVGGVLALRAPVEALPPGAGAQVGFTLPLAHLKAGAINVTAHHTTAADTTATAKVVLQTAHKPSPDRLTIWLWGGGGSKWYMDHGFTTLSGPGWETDFKADKWVRALDQALVAGGDVGIRPNGGLRDVDPTTLEDPDATNVGMEAHVKKPVANPFHAEVARVQNDYNRKLMEFVQHFPQVKTAFFNTEIVDGLETNRNAAGLALMQDVLGTTERPPREPKWVKKGVLADDDPLYQYWKFHYQQGNGLPLANKRTVDMVKRYRPDILTVNDPYREAAFLDMFPGVDVVSTWTYTNPDPKMMLFTETLRAACGRSAAIPMHTVTLLNYPGQLAPTEDWMLMGPARTKVTSWINLSRAPKALGYYYSSACNPQGDDTVNVPYATSETIRELSDKVFKPYGPFFTNANVAPRKIAVLSSMASGIHSKSPNLLGHYICLQAYHFYTLLAMNHLNADIVLDETIERHGLGNYDVLVLPKCDALTESVYKEVRAFQEQGGTVIADQYLGADLPGVLRFDFDFTFRKKVTANAIANNADFADWNDQLQPDSAALKEVVGVTALDDQRIMESFAVELKAGLAGKVEPDIHCDTPRVLTNLLEKNGAQYLVLVNDNRVYGERAGLKHKAVLDKLLPIDTVVTLRNWKDEGLAVYDMLRQKKLPTTNGDAGWHIPVSLTELGGTILALYPEPPTELRIATPPTIVQGGSGMLSISLVNKSGVPLAGLQPMELTLTDASDAPSAYSDYYCAQNGRLALPFVAGLNDVPGTWKLSVRDLTSGLTTAGAFDVRRVE
jgi:hypothetical protein